MIKKSLKQNSKLKIKNFLKDFDRLNQLHASRKHSKLILEEYLFDNQLLTLSHLYRTSRIQYLNLGGTYVRKLCSTLRSLRTHDLFKNEIEYTPSLSEFLWFKEYHQMLPDPEIEIDSLFRFSDISLFHEQNHRIIWSLLPPPPTEESNMRRYLNFAESLVVTLDIALGVEIGRDLSPVFERMNLIYRSSNKKLGKIKTPNEYRHYLLSIFCSTFYILELIRTKDILSAVNYVLPEFTKINQLAVSCSLELNEDFYKNTNPQWQKLNWKIAQQKLNQIHKNSKEDPLCISEDPLELETDLFYVRYVLDNFGL